MGERLLGVVAGRGDCSLEGGGALVLLERRALLVDRGDGGGRRPLVHLEV